MCAYSTWPDSPNGDYLKVKQTNGKKTTKIYSRAFNRTEYMYVLLKKVSSVISKSINKNKNNQYTCTKQCLSNYMLMSFELHADDVDESAQHPELLKCCVGIDESAQHPELL